MEYNTSVRIKKETDIQREICKYLRSQGLLFWRFSPDTYVQSIGRYVKHEYIPSGLPDIMVLTDRLIGLEVKKPGGKPSADQILMQRRFKALGHEYCVVSSLIEVQEITASKVIHR